MNSHQSSVLRDQSAPARDEDATLVARGEYGLDGELRRLGGERDDNFLVATPTGSRYFLKVAHPREEAEVTDLQSSILCFLEEHAPEIRVQRVVRNRRGETDTVVGDGPLAGRSVRVTTFLDGGLMRSTSPSSALRQHVGGSAATLDRALSSFSHPAAERHLLWDIQRASDLRPLMDELPTSREKDALTEALERFERDVSPRAAGMRRQVIHNDLSTDNLLVGEDGDSVVGVLDFGDVVRTPALNELAVATSYQIAGEADIVGAAIDVVRAFHSVTPLDEQELALLPGLITARVVTWVTIPAWRSMRMPSNNTYVLRNAERSRALFFALTQLPSDYFADRLWCACLEGA
ncbi:MAG TPA: phosphotransferase [Acidimicrobiales bacterium]|nr:phosphotransferase [Acidimicrobiales bacterium]